MATFDVTAVFKVSGLAQLSASFQQITSSVQDIGRAASNVGRTTANFGRNLGIAGAAVTGALGEAFGQFADVEDAILGVARTTDLTAQQIETLTGNVQGLSGELARSQADLLLYAQTAGQLGVEGVEGISEFTRVIAQLDVASNTLNGEEAAFQLSRILNVTTDGFEDVSNLASAIALLGDNVAATEGEIAEAANRVSRGFAQFGETSADAVGLAASFAEVGIAPELAGSTVTRAFIAINDAIAGGGEELEELVRITGLTAEELETQFADRATDVFVSFVEGIARVTAEGENASDVLQVFGLTGSRLGAVIPTLATRASSLADNIALANQGFDENVRLQQEFDRRTQASSFSTDQLAVIFQNLRVLIGEALAPGVVALAQAFSQLIQAIGPEVVGVFSELTARFQAFSQSLVEALENNPQAIADQITGTLRSIGQFFDGVVNAFNFLATSVFPPIISFLDIIGGFFGLSGGEVGIILLVAQFSGALAVLGSVIGLISASFSGLITIVTALGGAFAAVSAPVLIVIGVIAALVAGIAIAIDQTIGFQEAFRIVSEFFTDSFIPAVLEVGRVLFDTFVTGLTFILEQARIFGEQIVQFLLPDEGGFQQGLQNLLNLFIEFGTQLVNFFLNLFPESVLLSLGDLGFAIEALFDQLFGAIIDSFNFVIQSITAGINGLTNLIRGVRNLAGDVIDSVSETAGNVTSAVRNLNLSNLQGFATGGAVRGAGTSTSDSILARLSDGEYVMRAAAVSKFGTGFFDMLNSGLLPRIKGFADGGLVSALQSSTSRIGSATAIPSLNPSVGSQARIGRPLNLILPTGEVIEATTSEDTATKLQKNLRRADTVKASSLPAWY